MRRFVVLGHTQRTQPPLPLNDPAGAGGRWDLLARCVTSALLVSHGARENSEILLVLQGGSVPRVVRIVGSQVRRLNPDERSTTALLGKALESQPVAAYEENPLPGIHVSGRTLSQVMESVGTGDVVLLDEAAKVPLEEWKPSSSDTTFLLSDHLDFALEEREEFRRYVATDISLGPVALQADQCIIVVHNRLDRLTSGVEK